MVTLLLRELNFNYSSHLKKMKLQKIRLFSTESPSLNYCIELVRKNDYENFLCTLLLPKYLLSAGIILRAFNVEIATVQDHISESITGRMRFQFWEDTIDKIFAGTVPEHPVCIELAKIIHGSNLSKMYLKRLITARKNFLLSHRFGTLKSVEEYADMANSPIYLLLLELADVKKIDADHAASHLGKAQGITNLLRGTAYYSRRNMVTLPEEVLVKHKVSQEDILRNKMSSNVKDVFFEIASEAHLHLESIRKIQKKLDKTSRCIYLPAVALEGYLKTLQSLDFDLYHPKLQRKNDLLSLKLFWRKLFL